MAKAEDLIRKRLEEERDRLRKQICQQEVLGKEHSGYRNHIADDATDVFEQTKNLALRRNLERLLEQVEDALHRLDEGKYGICKDCGEEISPARLEAIPYATLCIKCQQRRES